MLQVRSYLKFYFVAGRLDISIALLYDQQHKKQFLEHATIQRGFIASSVQAPTRISVLSTFWNKICMAVHEAKQLCCGLGLFGFCFFLSFFLQEPNVIVLHLAKGSCWEII